MQLKFKCQRKYKFIKYTDRKNLIRSYFVCYDIIRTKNRPQTRLSEVDLFCFIMVGIRVRLTSLMFAIRLRSTEGYNVGMDRINCKFHLGLQRFPPTWFNIMTFPSQSFASYSNVLNAVICHRIIKKYSALFPAHTGLSMCMGVCVRAWKTRGFTWFLLHTFTLLRLNLKIQRFPSSLAIKLDYQ